MKQLPVVAIVGRPNVGKSTLFNRALRKREAIVHDMPGVTRDRKYSEAEWTGHAFTLVDTGGFLPQSEDVMTSAVAHQVEKAIEEADVLVLVVDGKEGLYPIDEEIAVILQRTSKPVLLVANKVDNARRLENIYEFYKLNLGDPIPVSAISGRGSGDLLDKIVSVLPRQAQLEEMDAIRLAIMGKPNVGKSSFVNAILGEEKVIVTEIPGTTRDAVDLHFMYFNRDFIIVDTAGLRKRTKLDEGVEYYSVIRAMDTIEKSDVSLVFISAVDGLTHQDTAILGEVIKKRKGVVLVVNKWDLLEKNEKTILRFEEEIRKRLKNLSYIPIVFISALTKKRVFQAVDVAKSVYEERRKRVDTPELNDVLGPILRDTPPFVSDGKLLKIHYVTQVKTEPPLFVFFTNRPQRIRENYKRFLESKIRANFGFMGVPISLIFRQK
ncbi:GTPase Der [bacterium BMS3Abin05]|nr:GTPase Der [bacterium BMS3Abin05]GBE27905.1 GTPase Der [bacterium BMS3Bbin03]